MTVTVEDWDRQGLEDTGLCDRLQYWSYNSLRKEPTPVLAAEEEGLVAEQDSQWNTRTQTEGNHPDLAQ